VITVWGSSLHVLVINVCYIITVGSFFTLINVPEVGDGKLSVMW